MQAAGRQSWDRASGKPDVMLLPATEIVFRRIEFAVKQNGRVCNAHRTIDVQRFCSLEQETSNSINFLVGGREGEREDLTSASVG